MFCADLCSTKVKYYGCAGTLSSLRCNRLSINLKVTGREHTSDWVFTSHNLLFLNIWKERELLEDPL